MNELVGVGTNHLCANCLLLCTQLQHWATVADCANGVMVRVCVRSVRQTIHPHLHVLRFGASPIVVVDWPCEKSHVRTGTHTT